MPEIKTATVQVFICDRKGKGDFLAAQAEINLSRHFGNDFKTGEAALETMPGVKDRGFSFKSISYTVSMKPKKDKHVAGMNEVI